MNVLIDLNLALAQFFRNIFARIMFIDHHLPHPYWCHQIHKVKHQLEGLELSSQVAQLNRTCCPSLCLPVCPHTPSLLTHSVLSIRWCGGCFYDSCCSICSSFPCLPPPPLSSLSPSLLPARPLQACCREGLRDVTEGWSGSLLVGADKKMGRRLRGECETHISFIFWKPHASDRIGVAVCAFTRVTLWTPLQHIYASSGVRSSDEEPVLLG